jgi:signal transduction histidine kinase
MANSYKSNKQHAPKRSQTKARLQGTADRTTAVPAAATIEEFKQQLSRDLHDDCGQVIALLQLRLALLQTALPAERPELGVQVVEISQLIAKLSGHLHALCAELRSPLRPAGGLVSGLRKLVAETAVLLPDLQIVINIPEEREEYWPATHQEALYHVGQEALTNALRHAHARRIDIDLQENQGALLLTVSDNGVGFILRPETLVSQGLSGMRERLERLGGSLEIASKTGRGTTLLAKVPLPEMPDA